MTTWNVARGPDNFFGDASYGVTLDIDGSSYFGDLADDEFLYDPEQITANTDDDPPEGFPSVIANAQLQLSARA